MKSFEKVFVITSWFLVQLPYTVPYVCLLVILILCAYTVLRNQRYSYTVASSAPTVTGSVFNQRFIQIIFGIMGLLQP